MCVYIDIKNALSKLSTEDKTKICSALIYDCSQVSTDEVDSILEKMEDILNGR